MNEQYELNYQRSRILKQNCHVSIMSSLESRSHQDGREGTTIDEKTVDII